MNCSADGTEPPAAAEAPVVATMLKNDRRSIKLIHSSAAQMLDVLRYRRGGLWMKTGGLPRVSGLQPCEPYHVEKASVNTTSTLLRRYFAFSIALRQARAAATRSPSP